jgi:hypothetical protein
MLYILCQNSSTYQDTLRIILEDKLGYYDYEVIDPKYHKVDRTFSNVVMLEPLDAKLKIIANKVFKTLAPDSSLAVEKKKEVFNVLKEAVQYSRDHSIKKEILQADIPRFADLSEFLHSFKGQVLELKLSDGRIIGIYPDEDKLEQKYVAEYHVSTILNLAKLQDVIGYTKLSVKDL